LEEKGLRPNKPADKITLIRRVTVVEVLSPRDSLRHVAQKIGEFLECGVPVVWLVDPERESVTVYRSLSQIEQHTAEDVITAEPVLPGFSCAVSRFFT